jgi:hypothetical protein
VTGDAPLESLQSTQHFLAPILAIDCAAVAANLHAERVHIAEELQGSRGFCAFNPALQISIIAFIKVRAAWQPQSTGEWMLAFRQVLSKNTFEIVNGFGSPKRLQDSLSRRLPIRPWLAER